MSFNPREYDYDNNRYTSRDAAETREIIAYALATVACIAWSVWMLL